MLKALKMIDPDFPHTVVAAATVSTPQTGKASKSQKDQLLTEFFDVFGAESSNETMSGQDALPPPMKGPRMEVHLRDNAKPTICTVPRKIPYALEPSVKAELKSMVDKGLLVPVNEPTDWCPSSW